MTQLVPLERIERRIYLIRNQKVMLDADLAELYGVSTSRLNEQVKRNGERFPSDFMFRLTPEEFQALMSQIAISKGRGGRRKLPNAFTEHGAIMVASVLNSPLAIEVSVFVVRAFIKLRETLASHKNMAQKLLELEDRLDSHDDSIHEIITTLKQLMEPSPPKPRKPIGFRLKGRPGAGT
jgi:hypothetical protein